MIHQLLSIFDVKAGVYTPPVAAPLDGAGVRAFADAVNNKDTHYFKHPEDYSIWNIGTFDDATGIVSAAKEKRQLAQAVALKETL